MADLLTHAQAPNAPVQVATGSWTAAKTPMNSGTIEFTITFGVALSNAHFTSAARSIFVANDQGGLWIEFGDLKLYNQTGSVFTRSLSGTTSGAVARIKIILAAGTNASSLTITQVSGTVGGTGTINFTTSGTYYTTTEALGIGGYAGNNQWDINAQIGTITDGAANSFTLTADAGSVALTGTASALTLAHKLVADPGAVAITGTAAGLVGPTTYTLAANAGAIAITNTDATLSRTRVLTADVGAVAITGTAATLAASGGLEFGVHDVAFQLFGNGSNPNSITLDTTNGSTFLVMMGGLTNDIDNGPTDNKGNTYTLVDSVRAYAAPNGNWGTAVWICRNANGGTSHTFSQFVTTEDESTMFVLELKGGATRVQSLAWSQTSNPGSGTNTSNTITTTAEALLVALWYGAAPTGQDHTAVPDDGFSVIESYLTDHVNGYIQAALATRSESTPGTYDVVWTNTPSQGAQMWLFAMQAMPSITADAGSIAITGTDAGLRLARAALAADASSVAITGTAATIVRTVGFSADAGAVACTPSSASLLVARNALGADAGDVAITGAAAALLVARATTADAGTVAIAGTDGVLRATRLLDAASGSSVVTGAAAELRATRLLDATTGAITSSGLDTELHATRLLDATAGSVSISGTDATLRTGQWLVADAGACGIAASDAEIRVSRVISASAGSYAIVGADANLDYDVGSTTYELVAGAGGVSVAGTAAGLRLARLVAASAATVVITGSPVTFGDVVIPPQPAGTTLVSALVPTERTASLVVTPTDSSLVS